MEENEKPPELTENFIPPAADEEVEKEILSSALIYINEYDRYGILDYLKLLERVEHYGNTLLDKNNHLKSYKVMRTKLPLNKLISLKSLSGKMPATEEECSLELLNFIEEFEKINIVNK